MSFCRITQTTTILDLSLSIKVFQCIPLQGQNPNHPKENEIPRSQGSKTYFWLPIVPQSIFVHTQKSPLEIAQKCTMSYTMAYTHDLMQVKTKSKIQKLCQLNLSQLTTSKGFLLKPDPSHHGATSLSLWNPFTTIFGSHPLRRGSQNSFYWPINKTQAKGLKRTI